MPVALAVALSGFFSVGVAQAAPASTVYMIDASQGVLWTVPGGTGTTTSTTLIGYLEFAIAVRSTINTLGSPAANGGSPTGYQYTLNGVPTGTTYAYPVSGADFYDGASEPNSRRPPPFASPSPCSFSGRVLRASRS